MLADVAYLLYQITNHLNPRKRLRRRCPKLGNHCLGGGGGSDRRLGAGAKGNQSWGGGDQGKAALGCREVGKTVLGRGRGAGERGLGAGGPGETSLGVGTGSWGKRPWDQGGLGRSLWSLCHVPLTPPGCRTRRAGAVFAASGKHRDRPRVGRSEHSERSRQPGVSGRGILPSQITNPLNPRKRLECHCPKRGHNGLGRGDGWDRPL